MPLLNLFKAKQQASSQLERRREHRHPSHFSSIVTFENKESTATVLNFSKSGLSILSAREIPPNEPFEIELAFNSERNVHVAFKSISCQKVETGYLVGAKLVEPSNQYDSLFTKIIQPRHSVVSDCW